jgi:putative sigma-54 modulation protein
MTVNIHSVHFDADVKLVEHVKEKLNKLTQFHDRITQIDVFLKLDNVVHQIKDKIAEIRVHVPGKDLFVKHSTKSFEQSFDSAFESIVSQIKKKKDKQLNP